MKTISRVSYALSVCAVAAMLASCGGSTSPSNQLPGTSQSTRAQSVPSVVAVHDESCQGQRSFQYIGHATHFKVPQCATMIYIDAKGASGKYGGDGGAVGATIPVTPGETLIVTVGGAGQNLKGGFNGGGAGAFEIIRRRRYKGAGGGGATDVRQGGKMLTDRVVVAGGGGGEDNSGPAGGTGGGLPDGGSGEIPYCNLYRGAPTGGGGGTPSSGGSGGAGSNGGSLGNGGVGVSSCLFAEEFGSHLITYTYYSGGGGGGYYGGGGGGYGGSGGGGSGYAEPAASNVSSQNGVNSGNGSALICWGYSNEMCGTR